MPRSKHRRKPGGKAVAHPGRGKLGKPLDLSSLDATQLQAEVRRDVADLPLFAWADDAEDLPERPDDGARV